MPQIMCVHPCELYHWIAIYLRSLTMTGVEHVAGGLFIVLTDLTAQPCCDEEGINGMPGALRIPRFPPAQLEKLEKSPVLIPGSLWQQ